MCTPTCTARAEPAVCRDNRGAMSRENVEVILRSNAAFNRGDLPAAFADWDADCEWRDLQHAPDTPELRRGVAAVREIWGEWQDAFEQFTAEIEEYADAGDHVLVLTHWRARGRGSGVALDLRTVDAYEFAGGRIVRATVGYADMAAAAEDLGLAP